MGAKIRKNSRNFCQFAAAAIARAFSDGVQFFNLQFVLDDEIVALTMVVHSLSHGNMVCSQFLAKIFVALHLVVHLLPHIHRQVIVAASMLPMMSFDL